MMLAAFEGSWLQSGKPWVQRMGSQPDCNRVVDGETPSLEACLVSPLDMCFFLMLLVVIYLQTLAMLLGSLSLELGVVIGLNFQPYGLSMQYIGF